MSTFKIFPNFGRGGGHRKSNFSQIQNSPHYPGVGGQENYGLFPQFVTFYVWKAPLSIHYIFSVGRILSNYSMVRVSHPSMVNATKKCCVAISWLFDLYSSWLKGGRTVVISH